MKIGVYGLGRFGSFWARLLTGLGEEVVGYNRTPGRSVPEGVTEVELTTLLESDAIFLCVAISAVEGVVAEIAGGLSSGTVVFDTCSVKVHPVAVMDRLLPPGIEVVGTHPMFGPDSAQAGVAGLPMIITPVRSSGETVLSWKRRFGALGLRVVQMSPEQHDREAAYTQGITHFIGRVLKKLDVAPSEIGTLGYRKILEVVEQTCNDPYQLFLDLQRFNPYTAGMREELRTAFEAVLASLEK